MEGGGSGPYAKVIPFNNGRYKRVADPVVPEVVIKLAVCCGFDPMDEDFDLLISNSYGSSYDYSETSKNKNYQRYEFEKSSDYSTDVMSNDDEDYMDKSSNDSNYGESDLEEEVQKMDEIKTNEESGLLREMESKESSTMLKKMTIKESYTELKQMTSKESGMVKWEDEGQDQELDFESYFKKVPEEEGVPILFYTKTREKPAFLMLTIDPEMEVIYMNRNKISRFFPIKLIGKLVTDREVIMKEFSRQISKDRNIKLENMVLFSASNFTDSVAIQFADESEKVHFINEVTRIKDLIKNKH
uniref:Uncharacterized protein n=1 Tax=Theileria parva TaxID=5875 RepID=Q4MYR2_THEPA|eukprot:XP_762903.1 hypothetical protein [Theileria parva strain Muguga]